MYGFEIDVCFLLVACLLILIFVIALHIFWVIKSESMPDIRRYEEEKYFLNFSCEPAEKRRFPSLLEEPSVDLSVIVPAYNEEKRLPAMLDECVAFLESRVKENSKFSYEIIIVDDGSGDATSDVGHKYCRKIGAEKLRVLTLLENRGKGGAVRLGMLSARGKTLLFADADGATKFSDIAKLEDELEKLKKDSENCVVVVGSRAHLEKEAIATRSAFRTLLMYGFHTLVWLFGVRNVRDTQCGFKLFTRKAAVKLFMSLHVERWAFDVELLYIARYLSMKISEVAVNWTEIEGSKLVPFWSWIQMGKDLLFIWLKYKTRLWVIDEKLKSM